MSDEKATAPVPVREITHAHRSDIEDVNPLIRQSTERLPNHDGNYIVAQQKKGQLRHLVPGVQLSVKDRMLNSIVTYYEVSRKKYPFKVQFTNLSSEQATMNFNVVVEFSLEIIDPVKVVEHRITSLLDCLRLDLKREVVRVASKHKVRNSKEAQAELQGELDNFKCEPYLKWTCHLVTVHPDEMALRKLREIEEKQLDMAVAETKADKNLAAMTAAAVTDKIVQARVDNIEEHQIVKVAPLGQLFRDKED